MTGREQLLIFSIFSVQFLVNTQKRHTHVYTILYLIIMMSLSFQIKKQKLYGNPLIFPWDAIFYIQKIGGSPLTNFHSLAYTFLYFLINKAKIIEVFTHICPFFFFQNKRLVFLLITM